MTAARKVLIVEDERMIGEYFKVVIESLGYNVCGIAKTADEAVGMARDQEPAMVFMDVRLIGDKDGVDAARAIHDMKPVPTVFVTGSKETATIDRIATDHPSGVLIKPVLEAQLKDALEKFCPLH